MKDLPLNNTPPAGKKEQTIHLKIQSGQLWIFLYKGFLLIVSQVAAQLADIIGITKANLSILKTGKAKAIRFTTLNAICQALDCQPGDILEYVEEGEK